MDPKVVDELLDIKIHNKSPEISTSKERYVIKRRAENFRMKGQDAVIIDCGPTITNIMSTENPDGEMNHRCRRKRNCPETMRTEEEANAISEEFHCSHLGGH